MAEVQSDELGEAKDDSLKKRDQFDACNHVLAELRPQQAQGTIPVARWVDAQNDEKKSRVDLTLSRDRLKVVYLLSDRAIDSLKRQEKIERIKATLFAPREGLIVERTGGDGLLAAGKTLMVIVPLDFLWAVIDVPERKIGLVLLGQGCQVLVPGRDEPIRGKVTRVSELADPKKGTREVRITIPNPEGKLRADMKVEVRFDPRYTIPGILDR